MRLCLDATITVNLWLYVLASPSRKQNGPCYVLSQLSCVKTIWKLSKKYKYVVRCSVTVILNSNTTSQSQHSTSMLKNPEAMH